MESSWEAIQEQRVEEREKREQEKEERNQRDPDMHKRTHQKWVWHWMRHSSMHLALYPSSPPPAQEVWGLHTSFAAIISPFKNRPINWVRWMWPGNKTNAWPLFDPIRLQLCFSDQYSSVGIVISLILRPILVVWEWDQSNIISSPCIRYQHPFRRKGGGVELGKTAGTWGWCDSEEEGREEEGRGGRDWSCHVEVHGASHTEKETTENSGVWCVRMCAWLCVCVCVCVCVKVCTMWCCRTTQVERNRNWAWDVMNRSLCQPTAMEETMAFPQCHRNQTRGERDGCIFSPVSYANGCERWVYFQHAGSPVSYANGCERWLYFQHAGNPVSYANGW